MGSQQTTPPSETPSVASRVLEPSEETWREMLSVLTAWTATVLPRLSRTPTQTNTTGPAAAAWTKSFVEHEAPQTPLSERGSRYPYDKPEVRELMKNILSFNADQEPPCDCWPVDPWRPAETDADPTKELSIDSEDAKGIADLMREVVATAEVSWNAASGHYLGYIPGGGLPVTALADALAAALNRYTGVWCASPGLVQYETNVVRWFDSMIGYDPKTAGGILTSGGSISNLCALVTARRNLVGDDVTFPATTVIYTTTQTHNCVDKSAFLAGWPASAMRRVPVDDAMRMNADALADLMAADKAAGLRPLIVVANAGTTNTGSVDPLDRIVDIAAEYGAWVHADGAYGGFFAMTERGKAKLKGLERCDSVTLDPHKGLFLPYGTGALLVKKADTLKTGMASVNAGYLPSPSDDPDFVDYMNVSPELTKPYRGLRVWLPMQLYGMKAFQDYLDEKLNLAEYSVRELAKIPGLDVVFEPELSVVPFRWTQPEGVLNASVGALTEDQTNSINRAINTFVNQRQRVLISPTIIPPTNKYVLRFAILHMRTHLPVIDMALRELGTVVSDIHDQLNKGTFDWERFPSQSTHTH